MKKAILYIDDEILCKLFDLPDNIEISDIKLLYDGKISILLEGDGLPDDCNIDIQEIKHINVVLNTISNKNGNNITKFDKFVVY